MLAGLAVDKEILPFCQYAVLIIAQSSRRPRGGMPLRGRDIWRAAVSPTRGHYELRAVAAGVPRLW